MELAAFQKKMPIREYEAFNILSLALCKNQRVRRCAGNILFQPARRNGLPGR